MPLGHKNLRVKYIAVLTISSSPLKIMDKEIAVYIYPKKLHLQGKQKCSDKQERVFMKKLDACLQV